MRLVIAAVDGEVRHLKDTGRLQKSAVIEKDLVVVHWRRDGLVGIRNHRNPAKRSGFGQTVNPGRPGKRGPIETIPASVQGASTAANLAQAGVLRVRLKCRRTTRVDPMPIRGEPDASAHRVIPPIWSSVAGGRRSCGDVVISQEVG